MAEAQFIGIGAFGFAFVGSLILYVIGAFCVLTYTIYKRFYRVARISKARRQMKRREKRAVIHKMIRQKDQQEHWHNFLAGRDEDDPKNYL